MNFSLNAPTSTKSAQGSRVAQELELLRQKQLAKNQRQKLKDSKSPNAGSCDCSTMSNTCELDGKLVVGSPLTTPEEAQAFLAAMRNKSQEREISHQPPSHLSADGLDSWYMQQRKREQELRERRKEAEALLRGYRGYGGYSTPTNQASSEILDDPSGYSSHSNGFQDSQSTRPATSRSNVSEPLPHKQFERSPKNTHQKLHRNDGVVAEEKKDSDDVMRTKSDERAEKDRDGDAEERKHRAPTPLVIPPIQPYGSETVWRDFVSDLPGATFPAESGRYHLYLSYACPGSHRALIVRALKGLEDAISVTYVHPTWRLTNPADPSDKHRGW